jgi:hypothetical protein
VSNQAQAPTEQELRGLALAWGGHVLEFVTSNPGVFAAYTSWAARTAEPGEKPLTLRNLHGAEMIITALSCKLLASTPEENAEADEALRLLVELNGTARQAARRKEQQ